MTSLQENPYKLLIAEDDDDDYLVFTIALQETSFVVKLTRAIDGEMLMKVLMDSIPDILFLDLHMPCKDGHQCIAEIRANRSFDALPIIIYTSRNDSNTIDRCYRAGTNYFTIKPDSVNDLKLILQHILTINWKATIYYPPKDDFVITPEKLN